MRPLLPLPYLALVFVASSTGCWVLASLLTSYNQRRRVMATGSSEYDRARLKGSVAILKPLLQDVARRLERTPLTARWLGRHRERYDGFLVQAGSPGDLGGAEFLAIKALAPFVVFLVAFAVLQGDHLLINVAAAVGSFWLPDNWIRERVRARLMEIESSLSDALDALSLMMRAGLDLGQAIAVYVDDPERTPLMEELAIMGASVRVGRTRIEAMEDMARRVGSTELANLVTAMTQAEQTGVSLAEYLANQADELRLRRFGRAEELAQKAQFKLLAPLMLLIMPCVFLVIFGPMFIAFRSP